MLWRRELALFSAIAMMFGLNAHHAAAQGKADTKEPAKLAPYATAHAKPLDAKVEVVDKADDYTQYRVEFNGIKDDRVPAFLYIPKAKANGKLPTYPAVLLQYGSGGNKTT